MTTTPNNRSDDVENQRPSTLPFDPNDLVAMRTTPAQYSRMVGVSKQAVSQWIKDGKVTLGPDGKLDPARATRQMIENTDPARLRARVLKQATASYAELRDRIRDLEAETAAFPAKLRAARRAAEDDYAHQAFCLLDEIEEHFEEAVEAHRDDRLAAWLDALADKIIDDQDDNGE